MRKEAAHSLIMSRQNAIQQHRATPQDAREADVLRTRAVAQLRTFVHSFAFIEKLAFNLCVDAYGNAGAGVATQGEP